MNTHMEADKIIRWGISATGHIADCFARDIWLVSGATLGGVTSRTPEKAQDFAKRYPGTTPFASLAEMAASRNIDAIYIASPHSAHLAQARIAIAALKPVLIEKPLAASFDQAEDLAKAAQGASVFAMEAMWSRFLPTMQLAREKIHAGALGNIRKLTAELAWQRPYDAQSRFFDPAAGGGALLDLGVYPVSLARFFLGEPKTIGGNWISAPTGVDISADISLEFGNALAEISCGFDRNGDNRLVIEGDRKTLVLGLPFIGATRMGIYSNRWLADAAFPGGDGLAARIARKLSTKLPIPGARRWHLPFEGKGLQYEIEFASNAIRKGTSQAPDCTLADSLATLKIIHLILAKPPIAQWHDT